MLRIHPFCFTVVAILSAVSYAYLLVLLIYPLLYGGLSKPYRHPVDAVLLAKLCSAIDACSDAAM